MEKKNSFRLLSFTGVRNGGRERERGDRGQAVLYE
jgi:hypothetical protein